MRARPLAATLRVRLSALLMTAKAQQLDRLFLSGRGTFRADDLEPGQDLAPFRTPGVSADTIAHEAGHRHRNHRDGAVTPVSAAKALQEVARITSSRLGRTRVVPASLSPTRNGPRFGATPNAGVEANTHVNGRSTDRTTLSTPRPEARLSPSRRERRHISVWDRPSSISRRIGHGPPFPIWRTAGR